MSSRRTSPWLYVAAGGFVAGLLDIAYACGFWLIRANVKPTRILQSVAAGLLGRETATAGGLGTAALGLGLHFFIATVVAIVYYVAARSAPALWQRPWVYGSLYGVAVYGVMQYIVVPLSRAGGGGGAPNPLWTTLSILVHAFGIGVPVALAARAALREAHGTPPNADIVAAARADHAAAAR
jgi:hypothetical protein